MLAINSRLSATTHISNNGAHAPSNMHHPDIKLITQTVATLSVKQMAVLVTLQTHKVTNDPTTKHLSILHKFLPSTAFFKEGLAYFGYFQEGSSEFLKMYILTLIFFRS
jgi:hypothetical protein